MKLMILGATGLVGGHVLSKALASTAVTLVITLVTRCMLLVPLKKLARLALY
ncbi:hypothetical protein [Aliidiomarina quisquiliarum]|uniref:hypothetical protein n=1 Tax=Aliidiomarina quisquiliarum TaxID=2938947 RepID=UPI00208EEC1A|nr:hypothetical protein [Aliidiomarina quisquiliarum]MCO4321216.1 hypothetical protein [Aliidiomarina quisquiliarum]